MQIANQTNQIEKKTENLNNETNNFFDLDLNLGTTEEKLKKETKKEIEETETKLKSIKNKGAQHSAKNFIISILIFFHSL